MGLLSLKNKNFQEGTFPSYLLTAQASSFLIHRFLLIQSVRPSLVASSLTVQPLYNLRDAMPLHCSPVLPTQALPKEAEDFPRGGRYFNHVPLLKELIYLPPEVIN